MVSKAPICEQFLHSNKCSDLQSVFFAASLLKILLVLSTTSCLVGNNRLVVLLAISLGSMFLYHTEIQIPLSMEMVESSYFLEDLMCKVRKMF